MNRYQSRGISGEPFIFFISLSFPSLCRVACNSSSSWSSISFIRCSWAAHWMNSLAKPAVRRLIIPPINDSLVVFAYSVTIGSVTWLTDGSTSDYQPCSLVEINDSTRWTSREGEGAGRGGGRGGVFNVDFMKSSGIISDVCTSTIDVGNRWNLLQGWGRMQRCGCGWMSPPYSVAAVPPAAKRKVNDFLEPASS